MTILKVIGGEEIKFLSACSVECYSAVAFMTVGLVIYLSVVENNSAVVIICWGYCYYSSTKPFLCDTQYTHKFKICHTTL